MPEYAIPFILCFAATISLKGPMLRVSSMILANWILGTMFVIYTQDATPWLFSAVIDTISARVILKRPASTIQAYIGIIYIIQIMFHAGFAFNDNPDRFAYYNWLTGLAFVQLIFLGGWIIDIRRKINSWNIFRLRDSVAVKIYNQGLE